MDKFFFVKKFLYERHENENDTIMIASSSRFEHALFYLKRSISKFDLRPGQDQVMTQVCQYPYFLNRLNRQVIWHHLCVSISILSRLIDEKRIVTSFDLR